MRNIVLLTVGILGVVSLANAEVKLLDNNTDRCELFRQLNGNNVPAECVKVRTRSIVVNRTKPDSSEPKASNDAMAGRIALRLQFAFNSAKIDPNDQPKLSKLADVMKDPLSQGIVYRVEGNTDMVGSAQQNDILSTRRADAVREYLIEQGVKGEQLVAKGNGFRNLVDPANPRGGANRRVEVINTRLQ
jgi:outer membrane protein OmpA-like peptidoglycan-associated protein